MGGAAGPSAAATVAAESRRAAGPACLMRTFCARAWSRRGAPATPSLASVSLFAYRPNTKTKHQNFIASIQNSFNVLALKHERTLLCMLTKGSFFLEECLCTVNWWADPQKIVPMLPAMFL